MDTKICKGPCKENKILDDFSKGKNVCKKCRNKKAKEKYVPRPKVEKPKLLIKTCKGLCGETKNINDFTKGSAKCKKCKSTIESAKQKKKREEKKKEQEKIKKEPPSEKYCKYCDKTKPLTDFPKGRAKCQVCRNKDSKKCYDKNHKKKPIPPSPDVNICSRCKEIRPKNEFIKKRNICKICKQKLSRENYLKDVEKHKNNLEKSKQCIKCKKMKKISYFAISKNQCMKCKIKYHVNYCKERRKKDPEFKIRCNLSSRLYSAVKSQNTFKQHKTMVLTGCSIYFLKQWLEHQFDSNMSWDNCGNYWHIDHVIPCAYFNLLKKEHQFKCFNWTNLRPCEGIKNIKKRDKINNWQILLQEIRVNHYKQVQKVTRC